MTRSGRRRSAGVLFLAVAALAALVGALAPSASATVTNVIPMNGQQEPIIGDTIYDNEVLWAARSRSSGSSPASARRR